VEEAMVVAVELLMNCNIGRFPFHNTSSSSTFKKPHFDKIMRLLQHEECLTEYICTAFPYGQASTGKMFTVD
jgi:hypothetical protein